MKKSVFRALLLLLIVLGDCIPALAGNPVYIKQLFVSVRRSQSDAKNDARANGRILFDHDVNAGTGGEWVYLSYTTTENPDSAVTDIVVVTNAETGSYGTWNSKYSITRTININNVDYVSAEATCGQPDLNRGAGGNDLFLYYTHGGRQEDGYGAIKALTCYNSIDETRPYSYYVRGWDGKNFIQHVDFNLNTRKHNCSIHLGMERDYVAVRPTFNGIKQYDNTWSSIISSINNTAANATLNVEYSDVPGAPLCTNTTIELKSDKTVTINNNLPTTYFSPKDALRKFASSAQDNGFDVKNGNLYLNMNYKYTGRGVALRVESTDGSKPFAAIKGVETRSSQWPVVVVKGGSLKMSGLIGPTDMDLSSTLPKDYYALEMNRKIINGDTIPATFCELQGNNGNLLFGGAFAGIKSDCSLVYLCPEGYTFYEKKSNTEKVPLTTNEMRSNMVTGKWLCIDKCEVHEYFHDQNAITDYERSCRKCGYRDFEHVNHIPEVGGNTCKTCGEIVQARLTQGEKEYYYIDIVRAFNAASALGNKSQEDIVMDIYGQPNVSGINDIEKQIIYSGAGHLYVQPMIGFDQNSCIKGGNPVKPIINIANGAVTFRRAEGSDVRIKLKNSGPVVNVSGTGEFEFADGEIESTSTTPYAVIVSDQGNLVLKNTNLQHGISVTSYNAKVSLYETGCKGFKGATRIKYALSNGQVFYTNKSCTEYLDNATAEMTQYDGELFASACRHDYEEKKLEGNTKNYYQCVHCGNILDGNDVVATLNYEVNENNETINKSAFIDVLDDAVLDKINNSKKAVITVYDSISVTTLKAIENGTHLTIQLPSTVNEGKSPKLASENDYVMTVNNGGRLDIINLTVEGAKGGLLSHGTLNLDNVNVLSSLIAVNTSAADGMTDISNGGTYVSTNAEALVVDKASTLNVYSGNFTAGNGHLALKAEMVKTTKEVAKVNLLGGIFNYDYTVGGGIGYVDESEGVKVDADCGLTITDMLDSRDANYHYAFYTEDGIYLVVDLDRNVSQCSTIQVKNETTDNHICVADALGENNLCAYCHQNIAKANFVAEANVTFTLMDGDKMSTYPEDCKKTHFFTTQISNVLTNYKVEPLNIHVDNHVTLLNNVSISQSRVTYCTEKANTVFTLDAKDYTLTLPKLIKVNEGAVFNLNSGKLKTKNAPTVQVLTGGTFTMNGGSLLTDATVADSVSLTINALANVSLYGGTLSKGVMIVEKTTPLSEFIAENHVARFNGKDITDGSNAFGELSQNVEILHCGSDELPHQWNDEWKIVASSYDDNGNLVSVTKGLTCEYCGSGEKKVYDHPLIARVVDNTYDFYTTSAEDITLLNNDVKAAKTAELYFANNLALDNVRLDFTGAKVYLGSNSRTITAANAGTPSIVLTGGNIELQQFMIDGMKVDGANVTIPNGDFTNAVFAAGSNKISGGNFTNTVISGGENILDESNITNLTIKGGTTTIVCGTFTDLVAETGTLTINEGVFRGSDANHYALVAKDAADVTINSGNYQGGIARESKTLSTLLVGKNFYYRDEAGKQCSVATTATADHHNLFLTPCDHKSNVDWYNNNNGICPSCGDIVDISLDADSDEMDCNEEEAHIYNKLVFQRNFERAATWYTFCVPFDSQVSKWGDDITFYEIFNINEVDANGDGKLDEKRIVANRLKESDYIYAGTPYFVKLKTAGIKRVEFDHLKIEDCSNIEPLWCASTKSFYYFYPVFKTMSGLNDGSCYSVTNGGFTLITDENEEILPTRWFMAIESRSNSSDIDASNTKISIECPTDVDSVVGPVDGIENIEGESVDYDYYSLDGRMVRKSSSTLRGVYIQNGLKQLKK